MKRFWHAGSMITAASLVLAGWHGISPGAAFAIGEGAAANEYAQWCSSIGGTLNNRGGLGCIPPTSGGSGLGGLSSRQQLGLGMAGALGGLFFDAMTQSSNAEAQRRHQEYEEAQRRAAEEKARFEAEQTRLAEERHSKLMTSLKGSVGRANLGLKKYESSNLQLKSGSALFGQPSNPSGQLRLDDASSDVAINIPEAPATVEGKAVHPGQVEAVEQAWKDYWASLGKYDQAQIRLRQVEDDHRLLAKVRQEAEKQLREPGTGEKTERIQVVLNQAAQAERDAARDLDQAKKDADAAKKELVRREREKCQLMADAGPAMELAVTYSLDDLREQLSTTQKALQGLTQARKHDAAERDVWEHTINDATNNAWNTASEMAFEMPVGRLSKIFDGRLKEANKELQRAAEKLAGTTDPNLREQYHAAFKLLRQERETVQQAQKRLEELKSMKDVQKLDELANSNDKDWKKFWEGAHEVADKVLGDPTIQKALNVTPVYGQAIKYGKHAVDSAHNATAVLLSWKRIKELNKDSEEYLNSVNAMQDRITNLVKAIKLKKQDISLKLCDGGASGGPLCACVAQM